MGSAQAPDWRLRFSLGVSIVWVCLGILYISSVVGWGGFVTQNAPALGSFLEGAFAPLAFLWLVVGFFLQQQQLSENTRTIQAQLTVMRRTAEQAEIQSRAIAADELHSRQDTFLRIREVVNEQLGVIGGWIVTSWFDGGDETPQLWRDLAHDHTVFSLRLVSMIFGGQSDAATIFWGTEIRSAHSTNFLRTFERLLERALDCDPNGMIEDALRDGSHGRIYRSMLESRPRSRV